MKRWILPIIAFLIGWFLMPQDLFMKLVGGSISLLAYMLLWSTHKRYLRHRYLRQREVSQKDRDISVRERDVSDREREISQKERYLAVASL